MVIKRFGIPPSQILYLYRQSTVALTMDYAERD